MMLEQAVVPDRLQYKGASKSNKGGMSSRRKRKKRFRKRKRKHQE